MIQKYTTIFIVLLTITSPIMCSKAKSAATAALIGVTIYGKSDHQTVKPAWATKYIPNGVPKQLDNQIQFMKKPEQFSRLGAELPKGLLLYGPPGTGKTTIARAIADELDATFISASGTDFTSKYYGEGAAKVTEFFNDARFEAARTKGKLVVAFIDEIDVIAPDRDAPGSQGYREQTTAFLTNIDGFSKDKKIKVYVIGATNRKDSIDPALLRAGRLENHVLIPLPSQEGRADILRHYRNNIVYKGPDISEELAAQTDGMSGSDLKKIINDAAILAGSENASAVSEKHLRAAVSSNQRVSYITTDRI